MTHAQNILDYLWSIAPGGATNGQIADGLGMWLKRYGNLASDIAFYFLTDDGQLEQLSGPQTLHQS